MTVLVSFRPTRRQVLARRLRLGAVLSAGMAVLLAVPALVGPDLLAMVWVVVAALPVMVGFAAGLIGGRSAGVEVDDHGVCVLSPSAAPIPWSHVVDVYAERAGCRTVVALRLASSAVVRLPAPYHGRLLAHDRAFEDKLLVLRQLWESHRQWPRR